MKYAFLLFFLATFSLFASEPWPGVKFAEVKAYAWPNDKETNAVFLDDMKLKPGAINPDGAVLTADQVKKLLVAVTGEHAKYTVARCHIPHNAFVFYDDAKKPVAFVEVCFSCLSKRVSPKGAADWFDMVALAEIFADHKLPFGESSDLAAFKTRFEKAGTK